MRQANENIIRRMDRWGINTIANWSSREVIDMNQKAFLLSLSGLGMDSRMMGLADVYAPDFEQVVEESVARLADKYRDNRWLVGYFFGNEPAWLGEEVRLCQLILDGEDRPIKSALSKYLGENGDTEIARKAFIHNAFDRFLGVVNRTLKKHDPNHINLGIRFGNPDMLEDEILVICGRHFDVLSFNCYLLRPEPEMLDRALALSGIPMLGGEYHFGTTDRGLAPSLWQVESQQQRGVGYRYYTEQAFAHPGVIGLGYFQWSDQDITGRGDGENYNCGLIDVTDRPYREQVEAMSETARVLYEVHSGLKAPFNEQPVNARGNELVPDLWNE